MTTLSAHGHLLVGRPPRGGMILRFHCSLRQSLRQIAVSMSGGCFPGPAAVSLGGQVDEGRLTRMLLASLRCPNRPSTCKRADMTVGGVWANGSWIQRSCMRQGSRPLSIYGRFLCTDLKPELGGMPPDSLVLRCVESTLLIRHNQSKWLTCQAWAPDHPLRPLPPVRSWLFARAGTPWSPLYAGRWLGVCI